MQPTEIVHRQIRLGLRLCCKMEEILTLHRDRYRLPDDAAAELLETTVNFAQCFTMLATRYNGQCMPRFNVTIKLHYLVHAAQRSSQLHPRRCWCYSGEDFQNKVKRIAGSCVRGTTGWLLGIKFVPKYRYGLTLGMLERRSWFA